MSGRDRLLATLRSFVMDTVWLGGLRGDADPLSMRLDVLERVVQLLRLEAGWAEFRMPMSALVAAEIEFETRVAGGGLLRVGRPHGRRAPEGRTATGERTPAELQVPLLLYLLHRHRAGTRIGALLVDFLNVVRPSLSPADAEATRTGVTRVMTTARSAARSLRLHGLLTASKRTAYRTWELSILGVLVAARLHEGGHTMLIPERRRPDPAGPRGAGGHLAEPIAGAIAELSDPDVVAESLVRLCRPDADVFDSFGPAVTAIATFCESLKPRGDGPGHSRGELRTAADELLRVVGETVPPAALAEDLAKAFALRELLGGIHPEP